MKSLNKKDFSVITQLFSMKEKSLMYSLSKLLTKYYNKQDIIVSNEYIYVLGQIPVTLISHLDTVHPVPPLKIFHDERNHILWSPQGLGADDRAGVFSIVKILEDGFRPSLIFTTGEEVSGIGATALVTHFNKPVTDTLFLIELDRQGNNDAVFYDCGNREFQDFICDFGFEKQYGTFSDIAIIGPEWDTASVNVSIGYQNEHTLAEILNYRDMFSTIEKIEDILMNCGDTHYDYSPYEFPGKWMGLECCDYCGRWIDPGEKPVLAKSGNYILNVCPSCAKAVVRKCKHCKEEFIIDPRFETFICEDCQNGK